MVVLLHAGHYGNHDPGNVWAWHVIRFLSYGVTKAAVPLFFFISGFLFAHQYDSGRPFFELLKRRFISLGRPYVYWSLIYLLKLALFTVVANYLCGRLWNNGTGLVIPLFSWRNVVLILGLSLFAFPIYFPLWYIRNLLLLFPLFVPLRKLLKSRIFGGVFLIVLAVCCVMRSWDCISGPWRQFVETGFSLNGVFCFSAGIYFKNFPPQVKNSIPLAVVLCLVWFVLAWPWRFAFTINFAVNNLSVLVGCAAIWCVYDFLPGRKKLESRPIVHYAFFIYVSHYVIMSSLFCRKLCVWVGRTVRDGGLLIYAARFIVTAIIAIALAYVLERYAPKLYRALSGGR